MIRHREKKVREHRLKKGLSDSDISTTPIDYEAEAKYYLESHDGDLKAAYADYKLETAKERKAAKRKVTMGRFQKKRCIIF